MLSGKPLPAEADDVAADAADAEIAAAAGAHGGIRLLGHTVLDVLARFRSLGLQAGTGRYVEGLCLAVEELGQARRYRWLKGQGLMRVRSAWQLHELPDLTHATDEDIKHLQRAAAIGCLQITESDRLSGTHMVLHTATGQFFALDDATNG